MTHSAARPGRGPNRNVTVIGAQWGDEGKGKIVDWLAADADVVVRFQGGHNAGHTLVIDGAVFKLSLLPSGIVRPGTLSVIGAGVVVDPWALAREMDILRGQGVAITPERLQVAENATLILPLHQRLDALREAARGSGKIGTTGRGIGPAYEDRAGRRALRLCDLAAPDALEDRLGPLLAHHNALLAAFGEPPVDAEALLRDLRAVADTLVPYIAPVWRTLDAAARAGRAIVFEGAQGALLDVDYGTAPFVTSSSTVAGQAATGAGCAPRLTGHVLGIAKAYTTRVGSGPFPTELHDAVGEGLGQRGHEFGTVTGRRRRCGWLDAALLRQAVAVAGVDSLALTKLDVLDGMAEIKICAGYRIDGQDYDYLPAAPGLQARATPVCETLPGWSGAVAGARDWESLPEGARAYVARVEALAGCPVSVVSTGPERADTILRADAPLTVG